MILVPVELCVGRVLKTGSVSEGFYEGVASLCLSGFRVSGSGFRVEGFRLKRLGPAWRFTGSYKWVRSPLCGVRSKATLLITPLTTTHEPPSKAYEFGPALVLFMAYAFGSSSRSQGDFAGAGRVSVA